MISIDKLNLSFGGFELFKEISFLIQPKDRIGLIGKNGAGKTTLLKIINGIEQPTSGSVGISKDITLGYTLPSQITQKAYINSLRVYVTLKNYFERDQGLSVDGA